MKIDFKPKFNANKLKRDLKKIDGVRVKIAKQATTDAAKEKTKLLKKDIRQGKAGDKTQEKLGKLGGYTGRRRGSKSVNRKPLKRLSTGIKHYVNKKGKGGQENVVKFVGKMRGIADIHQKGFYRKVTPRMRRFFLKYGLATLPEKSPYLKYFFLKKTTKRFWVPDRNIIVPFLATHEKSIITQVTYHYHRRMKKAAKLG